MLNVLFRDRINQNCKKNIFRVNPLVPKGRFCDVILQLRLSAHVGPRLDACGLFFYMVVAHEWGLMGG